MVRFKAVLAMLAMIVCTSGTTGVVLTKTPTVVSFSKTPSLATPTPVVADDSNSTTIDASESWSGSADDETAITVSPSKTKVTDGSVSTELTLAKPLDSTSTIVSTYRNWVGPRPLSPDQACYREAHIMDTCPTNFDRNEATNTCWAECPIDYPIECGMECLRQNDDCTKQIFNKIGVVINVGLNGIMYNWFHTWAQATKTYKRVVMCTTMVLGMTRALIRYTRNVKTSNPELPRDKLLAILYQSNNIVVDLPITIKLCAGKSASSNMWLADRVMLTSQFMLAQILAHDDEIVLSWSKFKAFMKGANFTDPAEVISKDEIGSFKDGLNSDTSCGWELKSLNDRTWAFIQQIRDENPGISDDDLRLRLQDTDLIKTDIATVTNNCMPQLIAESTEATAYKTRDQLRKTVATIVNDLIKSGKSNNGTHAEAKDFVYKFIDKGLLAFAATGVEMTGIPGMLAEYLQTICGPTQYIGEIDDGTHPDTLGLTIKQKAFNGSSLSWTRKGDGEVIVNFSSNDTEDVSVNIMSGGDKVGEVDVKAGGTATWRSNVTTLGGRTLYLDRWRPGFLGLPGTGGGSLLLWVPHAAEGGHLELNTRLNVS